MATHKVQAPNGSIIEIEGPDDATDQELIDAASQHFAKKQSEKTGPINAMNSAVQYGADQLRNMDALTYGAGAAAAAAGIGLGKKLKDKFFGGEAPPSRIEPQMDVSTGGPKEPYLEPDKPPPPPPSGPKTWEESLSPQDRELLERSKANAAAKTQTAPAQLPIPEPPAFIRNQPVVETPANPKVPASLQAPAGAVAPPVPAVTTPVAVAETPAPVPTPAEAPPKKEPKATKAKIDMPQGWGKGMSWLTHQYGVEGAQSFIDQYNKGKPYATYDEMMKAYTENTTRPKYSDIPKSVRQERGITSRSGAMAVPPPSLRPTDLGQGGSLLRSLTDPLQLKQ